MDTGKLRMIMEGLFLFFFFFFFFTNGGFTLSQGEVLLESDPPRTGLHQGVSALA